MTVTRRTVTGVVPAFEIVDITLPRMRVSLLSLGAALHTVQVPDAAGALGHVHLHLPDLADYADTARNPHLGATLGRYANRIAGGQFELDGTTYHLDVNKAPNTLHGGALGFDRRVWTIADIQDEAQSAAVRFTLHSADGDMGFPGALDATATYRIAEGRIRIDMTATCDAPTVVSLANHGYWNLDDSKSIAQHSLQVPATRRLSMDDTGIPTGIIDVDGSAYDLRAAALLGPAIDAVGGLDDCYLPDGVGMRVMARLRGETSGRCMTVSSDAPGLQVYTGNSLHPPFEAHQSVSLEAQRLPDAPNQPELGTCVLRPGEEYATTTLLEFTASDA